MKVHVHLPYGFDVERWRKRWSRGEIIGFNDEVPYGYHHAESFGATLRYSSDAKESSLARVVRKACRVLLGFDLVHAWRNRAQILDADIVWTHTESQHLAVSAVLAGLSVSGKVNRRPRMIAQSIWLFDTWPSLSRPKRVLYRSLMRRADILTVHSDLNYDVARKLFPEARAAVVRFGITTNSITSPVVKRQQSLNVLSVGNDRHRDWECLLRAVSSAPDLDLKLVSRTIPERVVRKYGARVYQPKSNDELQQLYNWAHVVVVPLKPNLHASGITVILEAVLAGIPVVATDVGGLRGYFREDEVCYVESSCPDQIYRVLELLRVQPDLRRELADRAQAAIRARGLTSKDFARRHVELSESLLDSTDISSSMVSD